MRAVVVHEVLAAKADVVPANDLLVAGQRYPGGDVTGSGYCEVFAPLQESLDLRKHRNCDESIRLFVAKNIYTVSPHASGTHSSLTAHALQGDWVYVAIHSLEKHPYIAHAERASINKRCACNLYAV